MSLPKDIPPPNKRIGFMAGQFTVPEDFDTMMGAEIEELFGFGSSLAEEDLSLQPPPPPKDQPD